ncbi:MAG: DUF4402 domain-containing protein [Candidatus Marinimicrobia bacterium]|nr:DUF4402 domain-containing protein [Candidatus Neomarinimicrobiota bacterium]MCF7904396.1 DUF4402 domain-containing protein [Candidatus Neomarinimicrobiota bacterium]
MLKHLTYLIIALAILVNSTLAQVITFSVHVSSSLNATKDQDMDFGTIISGTGLTEINLGDAGMGVFAITGNEEMDVIVTLTAPANLIHTGASSDVIPFTLNFAYANKGVNDINQAVTSTGGTARFQMRERESGPAGAPPTPPSSHHTPAEATAYLYIYGTLNVGNIDAGTYSADVDLEVIYD